ncbi:DUF2971 domain-containing protein [Pseudomonas sichuanensis]|uniref:DUF2971 domain-containing protein n=1 Tax=Pseudomonas sichuanensis TaxID=2213015 RepID=UPI002B41300E|nr:DUF2971 domain-containing protein [Pseudomonas sichuanensis]
MQLFHYTDVNAVRSILENGKMWLTDMRFLNDSEEMSHGIDLALELIQGDGVQSRISKEYAEAATEFVINGLSEHVRMLMNFNPIFVCSFSQAPDLLSQWRAYGNYAIEFQSDFFNEPLFECSYDSYEKGRKAYDASLTAVRAIGRSMRDNAGIPCSEGLEAYSDLIKVAAALKHESFSEEQEVRMIIEKIDCHYPVLFRARSGMLIPYIEVPVPCSSIKAIHVGPMRDQELAFKSMMMFVDEVARLKQASGDGAVAIEVHKSKTPFRSA